MRLQALLRPRRQANARRSRPKAGASETSAQVPDTRTTCCDGSYDWMMRLAASPRAPLWLALLAFAEGVFFPIPPDVILIPLVLQNRERAWRYAVHHPVRPRCWAARSAIWWASSCTRSAIWLLSLTGSNPHEFEHWYRQWGVLLLALPIPYKLTAIASGMFKRAVPAVLRRVDRHPRHPLLSRRGAGAALRRAMPGVHREAPGPGGQRRRPGPDRRVPRLALRGSERGGYRRRR